MLMQQISDSPPIFCLVHELCSFFRHSSAGSDEPWTPPKTPTTRTLLRWWSVWTVWRKFCSGPVRTAWTASKAGSRVGPRSSPPPVWFWTTARGSCPMFRPELKRLYYVRTRAGTDSDEHRDLFLIFISIQQLYGRLSVKISQLYKNQDLGGGLLLNC